MRKLLSVFVLVAFLVAPVEAQKRLSIVATTEDLAAIAREIAGDLANVSSIARGTEDPHFIQAKPSFMLDLRKADLFVVVGLDLEIGWAPLLQRGARNRRVQRGSVGYVDASAGVAALEVPLDPTRAEGDVHPYGNPHYWLDPRNGHIAARNITEGLVRVDPKNADAYRGALASFSGRLESAAGEWHRRLKPLEGVSLISYHRAWVYFEDAFGLRFVDELEPKPGIPPSPRHLSRVIERIGEGDVAALVHGPYYEVETYFDLFDHLCGALIAGVPEAHHRRGEHHDGHEHGDHGEARP
jgi:zinc/manganese transport system substrate-binding protein